MSETEGREFLEGLKQTWLVVPQAVSRSRSEERDTLSTAESRSVLLVSWRALEYEREQWRLESSANSEQG